MRISPVAAAFLGISLHAAAAPACPADAGPAQAHLHGAWHASIEGLPASLVQLGPHPEYAGSVRGHIERDGRRIHVAGDVVNGELTLEESENGTNISAAWVGDVVPASCGREFRGAWKAEGAPVERPFVLRRR